MALTGKARTQMTVSPLKKPPSPFATYTVRAQSSRPPYRRPLKSACIVVRKQLTESNLGRARRRPQPPFPLEARGPPPSSTPISRPTPLTLAVQTASGSNQPFCHITLCRQTDRPTHGIGDKSVKTALTLCCIDSERRANNEIRLCRVSVIRQV